MAFKQKFLDFLVSIFFFLRNLLFLALFPYRTMRRIILEPDRTHLYFFFFLSFVYFLFQENVRPLRLNGFFTFLLFIFNFYLLLFLLWFVLKKMGKEVDFEALQVGYSYTLFPTLIWFFANLFLFILLPPPRTTSFLGVSFSVFYLTFSAALFFWKFLLFYLLIRFLTGMNFFRVLFVIFLTALVFSPYFVLLYFLKISRIPFI